MSCEVGAASSGGPHHSSTSRGRLREGEDQTHDSIRNTDSQTHTLSLARFSVCLLTIIEVAYSVAIELTQERHCTLLGWRRGGPNKQRKTPKTNAREGQADETGQPTHDTGWAVHRDGRGLHVVAGRLVALGWSPASSRSMRLVFLALSAGRFVFPLSRLLCLPVFVALISCSVRFVCFVCFSYGESSRAEAPKTPQPPLT